LTTSPTRRRIFKTIGLKTEPPARQTLAVKLAFGSAYLGLADARFDSRALAATIKV